MGFDELSSKAFSIENSTTRLGVLSGLQVQRADHTSVCGTTDHDVRVASANRTVLGG
jgi:hypothetical protein